MLRPMRSVGQTLVAPVHRVERLVRPVAADLGPFGLGTFIYQAGRLAINLVAAAVLGPTTFGTWVLFTIALQYLAILSFGVPNGAGREIPYQLGAGRSRAAELAEDVSLTATLGTGILAGVAGFVVALVVLEPSTPNLLLTAGLLAAAILTQQLFLLQQVLLRSRLAFKAAAFQLAVVGGVVLVAGLLLVQFGVAGMTGAQVASQVAALALAGRLLRRRPALRWDNDVASRLVAVGFPIMLAGLAFSLLTTVDRWLVLAFVGRDAVGVYGLVGIAVSGFLVVATVVGQQFYPRIAFAFGEGRSGTELLAIARQQGSLAVVVLGVAIIPTLAVAWLAIPALLPDYEAALGPLTISLFGVLVYAVSSGFGNLLNSVGAQRQYLAVQLVAILADIAMAILLLRAGFGLVGVATATALAMAGYSLLLRWRGAVVARRIASVDVRTATEAVQ